MTTIYKVVQIVTAYEEETTNVWYDICLDLLPEKKATLLKGVLAIYDKIGLVLKTHTVVWTEEYSYSNFICDFSLKDDFAEYAPPAGVPIVIIGRYVTH